MSKKERETANKPPRVVKRKPRRRVSRRRKRRILKLKKRELAFMNQTMKPSMPSSEQLPKTNSNQIKAQQTKLDSRLPSVRMTW